MSAELPHPGSLSFERYNSLFEAHGGTDRNYLGKHFPRFQNTFNRVVSSWNVQSGQVVVDVGAHWLHQSLLYALAGFRVEAFNLPTTFRKERVKNLALAYGINLTVSEELETGECFYGLPESSVDLILFTEILEHITFNPVRFWRTIYRILKPGGRIIVTTPNFYALGGRGLDFRRYLAGHGEGISVDSILMTHTYGHHWKEYSMKEVCRYFSLLSSDFSCRKSEYVDDRPEEEKHTGALAEKLMDLLAFLRPGLHVEIELTTKNAGIEVRPQW